MDLTTILLVIQIVLTAIVLPAGALLVKILWALNGKIDRHLNEASGVTAKIDANKEDLGETKEDVKQLQRKVFGMNGGSND